MCLDCECELRITVFVFLSHKSSVLGIYGTSTSQMLTKYHVFTISGGIRLLKTSDYDITLMEVSHRISQTKISIIKEFQISSL